MMESCWADRDTLIQTDLITVARALTRIEFLWMTQKQSASKTNKFSPNNGASSRSLYCQPYYRREKTTKLPLGRIKSLEIQI